MSLLEEDNSAIGVMTKEWTDKSNEKDSQSFTRKNSVFSDAIYSDGSSTVLEFTKDNYGKFVYILSENNAYLCAE